MVSPSFGSVSLYLVDGYDANNSQDNQMLVSVDPIGLPSNTAFYYSFTGAGNVSNWTSWDWNDDITFNVESTQQIFFGLVYNNLTEISNGSVSFGGTNWDTDGINTWAIAVLNFDNVPSTTFNLEILSTDTSSGDGFASTPIPSIGLLIGTAFSGLFMFRRQVFKG